MGQRAQSKAATEEKVLAAASRLFAEQGYTATTVPQIADAAGVSVGSVAGVGSKDALFLRAWEELSTAASLSVLAQAASAPGRVTERVWSYIGHMLVAAIQRPEPLRDYFVAYLRASDHTANIARLEQVGEALRKLFPDDGLPLEESPAGLAAWTIWLAFSSVCFGIAASSYPPEQARTLMRSIVEAQCAPFEETA